MDIVVSVLPQFMASDYPFSIGVIFITLRIPVYISNMILKAYRLSELNFFVYIKSCQYSLYINHQKDYTAWTSYDKNNFLLLFIDILFLDRV